MANVKTYCSLDIETSGFDPLKDEILEVGFSFFDVTPSGCRVTEEWTRVFKPSRPVPAKILGLTGITQGELETGRPFSEFRAELQGKLGSAAIVGHNVSFDLRFLERNGLSFSGEVVDTLELVQVLLPTHHGYNLENLMYTFRISHEEAHRALADARAAIRLLERLLKLYASFPPKLKDEVAALLGRVSLPWGGLLGAVQTPEAVRPEPLPSPSERLGASYRTRTIYNVPFSRYDVTAVAKDLAKGRTKSVLVVQNPQTTLLLWRQGLCQGVFAPDQLLDEGRLESFLRKPDLTGEEARFLLKVLVWRHTNWQCECLLDLNLTASGGQFKPLVAKSKAADHSGAKVLCTDHATLTALATEPMFHGRRAVIVGLHEFEQAVSAGIGSRVSWGQVGYLLKSYYNPELNSGDVRYRELVLGLLSATDLFFGLVGALLGSRQDDGFSYITVGKDLTYSDGYQKVAAAAANFAEKLRQGAEALGSAPIGQAAGALEEFFSDQDNRVKWVELSEGRCAFHNAPVRIDALVEALLKPFPKVSFVDSVGSPKVLSYFTERLGLSGYRTEALGIPKASPQQALLPEGRVAVRLKAEPFDLEELVSLIEGLSLPSAVLLPGPLQIRELYDRYYERLQKRAFLLVQSGSGGTSKLFNNFGIRKNTLLVATDKVVLRFLDARGGTVKAAASLPVKSLVVTRLPFDQFTHPLQEAIASQFENPFEQVSLPKAVHNFHRLVQFFATPELQTVVLWDQKLTKPYARAFVEYLKNVGFAG